MTIFDKSVYTNQWRAVRAELWKNPTQETIADARQFLSALKTHRETIPAARREFINRRIGKLEYAIFSAGQKCEVE